MTCKYLDGGLIACNPTVDAVIDILEHIKESSNRNLKMVLSLDGGLTKPAAVEDVDFDEHSSFPIGQMLAHQLEKHSLHLEEHSVHIQEHAQHLEEHAYQLEEKAHILEKEAVNLHSHSMQKRAEEFEKRAKDEENQAEKEKLRDEKEGKEAKKYDNWAKGASIASLLPHNYKSFANVMKCASVESFSAKLLVLNTFESILT